MFSDTSPFKPTLKNTKIRRNTNENTKNHQRIRSSNLMQEEEEDDDENKEKIEEEDEEESEEEQKEICQKRKKTKNISDNF